VFATIITLVVL